MLVQRGVFAAEEAMAAGAQEEDVRGNAPGEVDVLGGDDDTAKHAGLHERDEQFSHKGFLGRGERGDRFISDEQPGAAGKGAGEGDTTLVPFAEVMDGFVREMSATHEIQPQFDLLLQTAIEVETVGEKG